MQLSAWKREQRGNARHTAGRSTDKDRPRDMLVGSAKAKGDSSKAANAMMAQKGPTETESTMPGYGPDFPVSPIPAVNVATVPKRSPLRYPGGKTWLIPHIRAWLAPMQPRPRALIEPFCGGGIVALTAVCESLVEQCFMAELDHDVAAFWHAALRHNSELCHLVSEFEPTRESVSTLADQAPRGLLEHGFRTLVLNRTRRGGILAPGAALTKSGENKKGLASRWYPDTIIHRLQDIEAHASQINFCEADGLDLLEVIAEVPGTVAFIDPPYTAGGKRAGNRLYTHHQIDHRRLFKILAQTPADFLMTYDRSPEIAELIAEYGFHAVEVVMKNTHHAHISELVITRRAVFN